MYIRVLIKTFRGQHMWKLQLSGRKTIKFILVNEMGGREMGLFG